MMKTGQKNRKKIRYIVSIVKNNVVCVLLRLMKAINVFFRRMIMSVTYSERQIFYYRKVTGYRASCTVTIL